MKVRRRPSWRQSFPTHVYILTSSFPPAPPPTCLPSTLVRSAHAPHVSGRASLRPHIRTLISVNTSTPTTQCPRNHSARLSAQPDEAAIPPPISPAHIRPLQRTHHLGSKSLSTLPLDLLGHQSSRLCPHAQALTRVPSTPRKVASSFSLPRPASPLRPRGPTTVGVPTLSPSLHRVDEEVKEQLVAEE
ncbi:hypothetical protein HETIRDRAFT_455787 [Heterobasidion irregulare TC 32-1]|uniref:Uncharacterized protein n=1 Tax=Heterobasidion irregulare (strain TC 32-1) TaxID=747525 RepID=W4JRW7_HETIT|nr:uncharacterized protein HETIRDRAFT_455787 [Heterobasidion irregulare TC 32-1]ETW76273.1 hypothetical protein HETIRDRAFT_455787 [Heterobasidion irregulare TC 32-1]